MFCAVLWDFDGGICGIDDGLRHALDFIAEDEGVFLIRREAKLMERPTACDLLDGKDEVAAAAQGFDGRQGVFKVFPINAIFRAERRFVDFYHRWAPRDAT